MKTYVLALMIFGFFSVDAASQPYGGDDNISIPDSMRRAEAAYDADIDERTGSAFSIPSHSLSPRRGSLAPSHTAIDMGLPAPNEAVDNSTLSSMKSFSQVNPSAYFDWDKYLKEHVQEMMGDEKRYKSAARVCRWCNVSWLAIGGASTASSMIISAIGATEYMDPQLSRVLSVVLGVVSGGCIWAASQSKNAAREYHEEVSTLQKSLGVPDSWLESEVDLKLEPFKADASHQGESGTAH
jgi:hypothetical protein